MHGHRVNRKNNNDATVMLTSAGFPFTMGKLMRVRFAQQHMSGHQKVQVHLQVQGQKGGLGVPLPKGQQLGQGERLGLALQLLKCSPCSCHFGP